MGVFTDPSVAEESHSLSLSSSAPPANAAPIPPKRGPCPPRNPLGNCLLFMPVVFRGAAIGGLMAVVVGEQNLGGHGGEESLHRFWL